MSADEQLRVAGLRVRYGHVAALNEVSLTVARGTIVGLIGPNGAGKSSLLRAISRLVRPTAGEVTVDGRSLHGLGPHQVTRLGVAHVPEGRKVIAPLSVEENLLLSAGVTRQSRADIRANIELVYEVFTPLAKLRDRASGALSGGEQQMLAFGRALVQRPRFLLLDEPSMGLAPVMIDAVFDLLSSPPPLVAEAGVLLAEQSAVLALEVSSYAYVISGGRVQLEGASATLAQSAGTLDAYLGTAA